MYALGGWPLPSPLPLRIPLPAAFGGLFGFGRRLFRCRLGYGFCWLLMLVTLRHFASDFLIGVIANDRVGPCCVANERLVIILRSAAR